MIGIVFGGASSEHRQTIKATRILYREVIQGKLDQKYRFEYFYLTKSNQWMSQRYSKRLVQDKDLSKMESSQGRILDLGRCDVLYSTMMGPCGENGNIMGLADLLKIPIIGCGILASALTLDKHLSKIVVESLGIPVVEYLCFDKRADLDEVADNVKSQIGFPCFVKPTNQGTCSNIFRANSLTEFRKMWKETTRDDDYGEEYLVEKFIPNLEVRVFIFEGPNGKLHTNDRYTTKLKEKALVEGGGLFDHVQNHFSDELRRLIRRSAKKIFHSFGMKDYARIDFFVEKGTQKVYFNEANTQPFIGSYNVELMEKDGFSYAQFFKWMIERNI